MYKYWDDGLEKIFFIHFVIRYGLQRYCIALYGSKYFCLQIRGGFKKKKIMEFSIKLAGWVLDDPVFH